MGQRRTDVGGDFSILSRVHGDGASEAAVRDWYPTQLDRVFHTLGTVGVCDFFPPNVGFTWYLDEDRNVFGDSLPGEDLAYGRWASKAETAFRVTSNEVTEPDENNNGRARALHGMSARVAPRAGWMMGDTERHDLVAQMTIAAGESTKNGGKPQPPWADIQQDLTASVPFFAVRPPEWPSVSMALTRLEMDQGRLTSIYIRMVNPISGDIRRFSFHTIGTTLRGARMQRDWTHFGGIPGSEMER